MRRLIWIFILIGFIGCFRTGCESNAEAANVMLTKTYSFKIIDDIVVTNIKPGIDAIGVRTNSTIECDVNHSLPITSAVIIVSANGEVQDGSTVITNKLIGGKHVVWTPNSNLPMLSNITWTLTVGMDNGL